MWETIRRLPSRVRTSARPVSARDRVKWNGMKQASASGDGDLRNAGPSPAWRYGVFRCQTNAPFTAELSLAHIKWSTSNKWTTTTTTTLRSCLYTKPVHSRSGCLSEIGSLSTIPLARSLPPSFLTSLHRVIEAHPVSLSLVTQDVGKRRFNAAQSLRESACAPQTPLVASLQAQLASNKIA